MGAWSDRLSTRLLGVAIERQMVIAVALIAIQLAAAFMLTNAVGGTHHIPPHAFYLPIGFAGLRFGLVGAVPTAVIATILAGPLTPSHVATGTPQNVTDWVIRGVFFLAVGATLPAMMRRGTTTIQQDRHRLHTEMEVRRGLERDEFVVFYQPVVELDTGRIVGAEALLRWDHPQRGFLTPDAFIHDVERIGSLATWVLAEATATAARWRTTFALDDFSISVNVSAQNLAQPDFVAQVRTALRAAQLDPKYLCIELTESMVIDDLDIAAARLQVLRSLGARTAVDDFGTGHSTLAHLRQLPIDVIKIDRSFVSELERHQRSDSIVGSLSQLAHELGATCVAEGVETEAQRAILMGHGCNLAQGYLFARPIEPLRFEELLAAGGILTPPQIGSGDEPETVKASAVCEAETLPAGQEGNAGRRPSE